MGVMSGGGELREGEGYFSHPGLTSWLFAVGSLRFAGTAQGAIPTGSTGSCARLRLRGADQWVRRYGAPVSALVGVTMV
jgi:hypothetical protein